MQHIEFSEDSYFELLILCSLLARKNIKIKLSGGIKEKISFINEITILIPALKFSIENKILFFSPAPLLGGKKRINVNNIPRFTKFIALILLFSKENSNLCISGISNGSESIDITKMILNKLFESFKYVGFNLNIIKRGFSPKGEADVVLQMNRIKKLDSIELEKSELFDKIQGVVVTARIGSDISTRMMGLIKDKMKDLCETKVTNIVCNKNNSGPSPGFECSVFIESHHGIFYQTLCDKYMKNSDKTIVELAEETCRLVLEKLDGGGLFDESILPSVLTLMALGHGISKLRVGLINKNLKDILEILKIFFHIEYFINKENEEHIITIIGSGFINPFYTLN